MFNADVVFIHPPSLYDFRKKAVLHGPISDVIPSGPIFEMYPIGFLSLCGHLEAAGFSTRIINVANKMLNSMEYDPEEEIRRLKPKAFGIDLHWLPHVQGSLAIGEIIKRHHPGVPIIYGGYSATYFHEELIRYPFVDYVVRGDSAEWPLVMLIKALTEKGGFDRIPNLTYKDREGRVVSSEISNVPGDNDYVLTAFDRAIEQTFRFWDLKGSLPFQAWMRYPVTAVFPYKGCQYNCKTCGGSRFASKNVLHRTALGTKSPQKLASELKTIQKYINAPSMIIGDILQNGRPYADQLLDEIRKIHFKNELAFEFFAPPSDESIARIQQSVPKYNVEISPESHDENVRRAFGRPFTNQQLEKAIESCLRHGCRRIDLFFMIGLPQQTFSSVMRTIDYCETLLDRYGERKNLHPFIAPLAPFVDPGSEVWENPEKHGYRLFARTLEEHRRLMESAWSWKYFLNYETRWMTRDEIVSATYEAGLRLNALKRKHGLISRKTADRVEARARTAVRYMNLIDEAVQNGDDGRPDWDAIAAEIRELNVGALCDKNELNWPVGLLKFNIPGILKMLLRRGFRKRIHPGRGAI
ncbi:MAG: TIGR04190 family B12-binding domain/radical SAM domain protein [Nitrospirae bacterium]|nr:TIGR04190 family B12-binding domain/radical SAM domain protein [Nitrospirota bacterium]